MSTSPWLWIPLTFLYKHFFIFWKLTSYNLIYKLNMILCINLYLASFLSGVERFFLFCFCQVPYSFLTILSLKLNITKFVDYRFLKNHYIPFLILVLLCFFFIVFSWIKRLNSGFYTVLWILKGPSPFFRGHYYFICSSCVPTYLSFFIFYS